MDDLLVTKLSVPPGRPNLVLRPRLVQRLDPGLQPSRKLTLVSAPAGYGKTTLVVEWLANLASEAALSEKSDGCQSAWLSLDEADNDPARFLIYLIAALEGAVGPFPESARALLQSPGQLIPDVILTSIINLIAPVPNTLILVLDNYHVIHNPSIHQQIAFLLDHQPAQMHLVLITREDPLLPVSRLRAREQLVEIRQDDLRFSLEECAEFTRQVMGIPLTRADVAALEHRTEGWVVGLQLAGLSMQGRSDLTDFIQAFTGSSRFILDYLIEEVFERQTPEVKDFLLKTSVLERLSGSLCDAVTERTGSQELLAYLEQSNLFIFPLDQSRAWYRYHHLFSELLSHRLRITGELVEVSLHQRASLWFEAKGYLDAAVHHALEARDWARSMVLIEQAGDTLLKRGELVTLIGWCERLPDGMIVSQPSLGLSYAWALSLLGQFDKADRILQKIEEMAGSIPLLMGQVASVQAYAARGKGDNRRAIAKSQQALSLLPTGDSQGRSLLALNLGLLYWHEGRLQEAMQILTNVLSAAVQAGIPYAILTAQIFIARTLASQGELHRAEGMLQKILREGGQVPILALAHYDLCGIYYEWNDLEKAADHLEKGLELCTHSGNLEFQNSGHLLKAFLLLARGDPGGALAEVEVSHSLSRSFNPATQARSAACHAQIALAIGDVELAANWVSQMAEDADPNLFYRFIGLVRPRLLIAQGQKEAASQLLKDCSERAGQSGWGYAWIAIRVLQVLAAETQPMALNYLEEALKASQAEGYIRTYIDAGRELVPLLKESAGGTTTPEYVGKILAAFGVEHKKVVVPNFQLVGPLSVRELEVLRLVAAGLSNREIARKLFISPGTAKTHIHNICGKLDVRNRTEAAMRAKELNLV